MLLRSRLFSALVLAAPALGWVSCDSHREPEAQPARPLVERELQASVHRPPRLTSVSSASVDALGRPIRVECATCHSVKPQKPLPESFSALKDFHQGLSFAHGELRCASCHVEGRVDRLRLADGRTVPSTEAMTLCAQCHGSQLRDYRRGSHGGMSGHWDQEAGGRVRNHCVDCHDPHVPRFQPTLPVLPPIDRTASKEHSR